MTVGKKVSNRSGQKVEQAFYISKDDIQMANNHVTFYSTSFVTVKMQIKTTQY